MLDLVVTTSEGRWILFRLFIGDGVCGFRSDIIFMALNNICIYLVVTSEGVWFLLRFVL